MCREKLGFVVFGHDLLGFFMTEIGGALWDQKSYFWKIKLAFLISRAFLIKWFLMIGEIFQRYQTLFLYFRGCIFRSSIKTFLTADTFFKIKRRLFGARIFIIRDRTFFKLSSNFSRSLLQKIKLKILILPRSFYDQAQAHFLINLGNYFKAQTP